MAVRTSFACLEQLIYRTSLLFNVAAVAVAFDLMRVICARDAFAEAAGFDSFPARLPVALFLPRLRAAPPVLFQLLGSD